MSKFKTQPFKHQLDGLIASGGREFFAYFCEMGTGKTWMAINDVASMWGEGKVDAALVFAPKGVHTNWVVNELPKHMPDWVRWRAVAWKSGAGVRETERIESILKPGKDNELRLLAMNWDALVHDSGFGFAHKFATTTQKLMIIGDESQRIKNPQAGTTKALMKLRKFSVARRVMSGSSVLNAPFDLFSQITFLDKYILETDSYFTFKSEYAEMLQPGNKLLTAIMKSKVRIDPAVYLRCQASANSIYDICAKNGRLELIEQAERLKMHVDDKDFKEAIETAEGLKNSLNPESKSAAKKELTLLLAGVQAAFGAHLAKADRIMNNPRRLPQIVAKKDGRKQYRNLDKLKKLVDPHCFRAFKDECLDLPPKIYKRSWYELTKVQRAAYKKMKDEARLLLEDGSESPVNKLAALMKLAQICSGFAIEPGSGNLVRIQPHLRTPKMELLKERLEDKDWDTGGTIIWARFREEQQQIEHMLQEIGLTYGVYNGSTSDDDRKRIVAEFESGELQVFLGQQRAGGTGITLVRADYVLYYSNTFSLEDRVQSEDRAHRIGQGKKVVYEDLLGSHTIEPKVLQVLEDKQDIADVISGRKALSFLDDEDEG